MKKLWVPLFGMTMMVSVCWANSAPIVSGVSATQRTDGSGIVDISYTLTDMDWNLCTISLKVSNDGGSTWTIMPSAGALSGDVGSGIYPGSKHIAWASKTDLPGAYGTNYRVQITADDGVSGPHVPPYIAFVSISDPGVPGYEAFNGEMSMYEITNDEYCQFLNSALAEGVIWVAGSGIVYGSIDWQPYFDTFPSYSDSQISYVGGVFSVRVRDGYSMAGHPVVCVSWYGATAFCDYYGFRLPTECEWSAVADYDGTYTYGCGTSIDHSKANYDYYNPLHLTSHPYTSPVGYYGAYGYGMCDMAGNVCEWTSTGGTFGHVLTGGGWNWDDSGCQVYSRIGMYDSRSDTGFRVCR